MHSQLGNVNNPHARLDVFSSSIVGTMARHFGSLGCKVRGIISYTLSPYELKAYAGAFSKGVPNMMFRIQSQIFRVVPCKYRSLRHLPKKFRLTLSY